MRVLRPIIDSIEHGQQHIVPPVNPPESAIEEEMLVLRSLFSFMIIGHSCVLYDTVSISEEEEWIDVGHVCTDVGDDDDKIIVYCR